MLSPRCRPISIVDGMVLVAAIAFSFLLVKDSKEYNGTLFARGWFDEPHHLTDGSDIPYLGSITSIIRRGAVPLLLPASFAMFTIRLRTPRPVLRRLGRQPGFAATSAVVLVVCVGFVGKA